VLGLFDLGAWHLHVPGGLLGPPPNPFKRRVCLHNTGRGTGTNICELGSRQSAAALSRE
jgi:hypothetical protein